ncbi:hypothetical protein GUJ93_ZPchr0004g39264 [Zizania palustris]|uniref:Uncharacterized protein n=1 Tax=Zizania palustris TaxID=103762 RepID=A0A8J5S741_ZIZPA|nr:hypothetical protein GUJ93_ZPchr0004g39264 [Zizania palustris]
MVLLFLERMYMAVIISGVRLLHRHPERRYRCDPLPDDDPELSSSVGRGAGRSRRARGLAVEGRAAAAESRRQ